MENNSQVIYNGIQQIGIGCSDMKAMFDWYRRFLGFDIKVFEDEASAKLMTQYTGGKVWSRQAILAMNMQGGGGLEIWQFTDRKPGAISSQIVLGDLGINMMKVRSHALAKTHDGIQKSEAKDVSIIYQTPNKANAFHFRDPWNNLVQVVEEDYQFTKTEASNGGVLGAVIGVSEMEASIKFYSKVLGYGEVVYDTILSADDARNVSKGSKIRRVLLKHASSRPAGGFCKLLGPTEIELIQTLDRKPVQIFRDRFWGDLGYIHLCFDVSGMDELKKICSDHGAPFTVDSASSFDMGEAAGRFCYVEDPDGTLIEMVETHRVPIVKSLGININLKKRSNVKPLPNWIVKAMKIHRVKG